MSWSSGTASHTFSVAALAGALLQFGKQGISMVHRGLEHCPAGRSVGSQALKTVIWQGRNQGLHWEAGHFKSHVGECFDLLASEVDPRFGDYRQRNMAIDIVELLGWVTVDAFEDDLRSLG